MGRCINLSEIHLSSAIYRGYNPIYNYTLYDLYNGGKPQNLWKSFGALNHAEVFVWNTASKFTAEIVSFLIENLHPHKN